MLLIMMMSTEGRAENIVRLFRNAHGALSNQEVPGAKMRRVAWGGPADHATELADESQVLPILNAWTALAGDQADDGLIGNAVAGHAATSHASYLSRRSNQS